MSEKASKISTKTRVLEARTPGPDDDLYAVAMLKVAMELKRSDGRGFERIFEETLRALGVDRAAFRLYLDRHMSQLIKTAKRRGY
jgi:hypothetical protein